VQKARACTAHVAELFRENKRGKDDESSKLERPCVCVYDKGTREEKFYFKKNKFRAFILPYEMLS